MVASMADAPTCGQGLAEHAAIPAALGRLMAAMADTLEIHTNALDLEDDDARREDDAYHRLIAAHRPLADALEATAEQMAGYRALPMGRHDRRALASPEAIGAFERFVAAERELEALLHGRLEAHEAMLRAMARAAAGARVR